MKTPSLLTSPQTPLPGNASQLALQSPCVLPLARRCALVVPLGEVCTAVVRRDLLLVVAVSATLPAPATMGCSATVNSTSPILYTIATTLPLNALNVVLVTRKPS